MSHSTISASMPLQPGRFIQRGFRLLGKDSTTGLRFVRDFGTANDLYPQLIRIRDPSNGNPIEFDFDSYSYHYGLFHGDQAIGTLTTTRPADGPIDCGASYPPGLIDSFRDQIFSTGKFRIIETNFSSFRTLRMMLRHTWQDQLACGARLAIINSERRLAAFYRRIGFDVIAGSEFVHPHLGTESVCLQMRADPQCRSFFSDLFEGIDGLISSEQLQEAVLSGGWPISSTDSPTTLKKLKQLVNSQPARVPIYPQKTSA